MQKWQNDTFIRPISEVSKPDVQNSEPPKPPLIDRSEKIYWFDEISGEIHKKLHNKPSSVDGVFFSGDTVYFVEFKTGFKKIRTKDNFDDKYAECPKFHEFCEDYKNWFFKNQDKETDELKSSIRFKVIESYITFEKKIFPLCDETENEYKLELIVVIDEDEIDDYENSLLELSNEHAQPEADKNNCFRSLSDSLKVYKHQKDKQDPPSDYYYDDIKVLSANNFERLFDELLSNDMINPSNCELQTT